MCAHKWKRISRPYQHLIDKAEGTSFLDSKVWILCRKCREVQHRTIGSLLRALPTAFFQAGIGV